MPEAPIPDISEMSLEKITEYARQMDLQFDRTDIAIGCKEIWTRMRASYDFQGKCHYCRKASGPEHTFEECVARVHGAIHQLYTPRVKNEGGANVQ